MGVGPLNSTDWRTLGSVRAWPFPRRRWHSLFRWISECFAADRDRLVLWLPIAFGVGIGLYFSLPVEPASTIGLALLAAAVCLAGAATITEGTAGRALLSALAALMIGFSVAKHRTDSVSGPVLGHRLPATLVQGRVDSVEIHGKSTRVVLAIARAGRLTPRRTPHRVRVSMRTGGEALKPGDWIMVRAVLLPPPDPAAPGDYDFGRAAFFRQIGAVGYAYGGPTKIAPLRHPNVTDRIVTAVELLRWRISARIRTILPDSTGSIAAALITGDRGGISEDDEAALRDAGLAHVLAIAGLHMALVGLGLFWTVRALLALFPRIALTQPIKKWAALAALVSTAFYLVISGAGVPATRAYIMLAVMLVAVLFDRPALSMRSVALAAAIILAIRPESLVEPGFQMSFAAVVGLVAVAEWERSRPRRSEGLPLPAVRRYVRGIATTSFVGSLATAPYAAIHFDRATHYAVLGNLGAMPIMGFLTMPAAALAVIVMPFGLDEYPLRIMGLGIEAMLAVGRWVSGLPGAISLVSAWPMSALLLMTLGGLWIALWRANWRWLAIVPMAASVLVVLQTKAPDVLVARDGLTVAVRGSDGLLHFLRPPKDKYSAQEWLKRDGDDRTLDQAVASRDVTSRCDTAGCVARAGNNIRIATPSRPDAVDEDCARNDIVISAVPTRHRCSGPRLVIDRFDVAHNGAYAIWLSNGKINFHTVQQARGQRPWSNPSGPQYRRSKPTSLPWMRTRSEP